MTEDTINAQETEAYNAGFYAGILAMERGTYNAGQCLTVCPAGFRSANGGTMDNPLGRAWVAGWKLVGEE